jgi:hypothetical protein
MHLMAMATAGIDGRPAARIMTVRGASREFGKLWFHTDRRSPKVADLKANRHLCLVGFDPRDGVELRLSGQADLLEAGPDADRHWHQTEFIIRHLYASPLRPGDPAPPPDPELSRPHEALPESLTRRARSNFVVIEVNIDTIDWFQILDTRSSRAILRASTGWRTEYIAVTT